MRFFKFFLVVTTFFLNFNCALASENVFEEMRKQLQQEELSKNKTDVSNQQEFLKGPEHFTMRDLPWYSIEASTPENCVINNEHFFKNINAIDINFLMNVHLPFKKSTVRKSLQDHFVEMRIKPKDLVPPLLEKYFSASCIPIGIYTGSLSGFDVPHSKIILDMRFDYIESELIGDDGALYSIVVTSSYRRFIETEKLKNIPRGIMPQKSVTYSVRMYPRILRVTDRMSRDEVIAALEKEISIQLDYYIARMIFDKPIWNKHIENEHAYDFYGTADQAYWPFQ